MDKILLWSLLLTFSGSQAPRSLAQRNIEFAVDLYQAICSAQNNIIFSPLGTTLVLGMVQLGAKGKAQEQIRQTLKFQETSIGEILTYYHLYWIRFGQIYFLVESSGHRTLINAKHYIKYKITIR